jgi:hypothetical protein
MVLRWDVCVETAADEEHAKVSNAGVLDKALIVIVSSVSRGTKRGARLNSP